MIAIVFDTETTGLLLPSTAPLEKQPRIIEVGAACVDTKTGKVKRKLSQLLDPQCEISEEITKITGIKNEDLRGMPTFGLFLPQLKKFFKGSEYLVCHNAPFDSGMLRNDLARTGVTDFPWPKQTICTAQEYTALFGYRPRLVQLYEHFMGKPLEQKHRALDDVMAMIEVLDKDGFFGKIGG